MNSNRMSLWPVFVVALGLIAGSPPGASATFHSNVSTTYITSTTDTENVLTTGAGTVKCTVNEVGGTFAGLEVEEISLSPKYESCTAFGLEAHVTATECKLKFTWHEEEALHMSCSGENTLRVTPTKLLGGSRCTLTIGSQTPTTNKIDYINKGTSPTRHITLTWTLEGLSLIHISEPTRH